jgi:hypothetical protein
MKKSKATGLENQIESQIQLSLYRVPKKNHSEMLKLDISKFDPTQLDSVT